MNVNRHAVCTLVTLGVVALGTGLPASVAVANPSVGSEIMLTPTRRLDPREAAILASAGTRVLVRLAEARGAIWEKDADRAREELRKAENLLNLMRSTMPTANAKNRIWVARRHLEYEETQQVLPDLVPIDQELVFLEGFFPTGEARSHLEKARALLENGDKRAGLDELKAVDAALVYEEVDSPISETEAHVSRGLSELAIGETEKADSALQAAEHSVQIIVAAARGPLTRNYPSAAVHANEQTGEE